MANHTNISFFRIILPHILQNGTLELPRNFTKKHWKDFSKHVYLEVPTGAKSKMKMKKSDGRALLHDGWQDFVNKYSIKDGYFLVFRYQGRSNFIVQIFDLSTEEIQYVKASHMKKLDFDIKEEECDDDDNKGVEIEMDNQSRKLRSRQNPSSMENNFQREKAVRSQNPHFSLIMKPAYVSDRSKCCYLHIPKNATSFFHNKGKDDILLSLKGEKGKVWSMKYYVGSPPNCLPRITSGWSNFTEENDLKEGDVCTFEPVSSIAMIFQVTITRKIHEQADKRSTVITGTKRKRPIMVKEKSKAIKCSETSFTVTMTKGQVQDSCRLNIPRAHSTRHLLDQHGNVIFLHLVGGKTWCVKCNINGSDARFIYGWKDFVVGNDLQVGDCCVFELIPGKPNHYKVTMFSGATVGSSG